MSEFFFSQCVVATAFLVGIASFQFKYRRHVLYGWCVAAVLNSIHFFILGRPAPGALVFVNAIRFLIAAFTSSRYWMIIFMLLSIVGFALTFKHPLSLLALFSTLLGTYGSFHSDDRKMRLILMVCTTIWVLHNVLAFTPVAAVMELAFLASNVIGYRRIYGRLKI